LISSDALRDSIPTSVYPLSLHDALPIFEHVFLQALDRAVLVQHAVDLDLGDRIAGDRGQQHAPQCVAEGMAVATLERFDHDLRPVAREAFDLGTTGAQDLVGGNCHIRSISCRAIAPVDAPPWTFG